jgi:hypothetical protein
MSRVARTRIVHWVPTKTWKRTVAYHLGGVRSGVPHIPEYDSQMNSRNDVDDLSEALAKQNLHHLPNGTMMDMTPNERLQALEDIHGVIDLPEEDPEIIQTRLVEMDKILTQLDPRQRGAFDQAVMRSPAYVKRFRLAFLRADAYDAAKAAQRMAAHFEARLSLFQTADVLGRDIKLSDLSAWKEDVPLIESGAMQLLKNVDRAGRSIILICSGKYPYAPYNFPSLVSALAPVWYVALSARGSSSCIRSLLGTVHVDVECDGSTDSW